MIDIESIAYSYDFKGADADSYHEASVADVTKWRVATISDALGSASELAVLV